MKRGVVLLAASAVFVLAVSVPSADGTPSTAERAAEAIRGGVPLGVDRCVEIALDLNPSLRSSRESTRATERAVLEAYAAFFPRVDGGYDGSRTKIGYSEFQLAGTREFDNHALGIYLNQTLFSFSGVKSIHRARNSREAGRAGFDADRQGLIYEVRAACHGLLMTVDLLEVARENLRVGEEQLKLAEKRKEVGAGVTADVLKASAQVEANRLDVITAEKNLATARAELLAFLGMDVTLPIEVEPPKEIRTEVPRFDESMRAAEENRPDLREMKYAARASEDGAGAAWGEYVPSLGGSFSYGWRDTMLSGDIFDETRNTWTARISLDVPLFNVGAASRVRQEKARAAAARHGLEATRKGIELEIQEAILSIEEGLKKMEAAARTVAAAEEDLRVSRGKYEHGLVPILDLIEAQAALREARAAEVEATYDHMTARAAWEKAVGAIR
ncbi:MAG: TolC family protein [Candidatus Eisenbacteria bacterium]|nr:TolC family protein [Candidatus Eisenbacteria bacterium]